MTSGGVFDANIVVDSYLLSFVGLGLRWWMCLFEDHQILLSRKFTTVEWG
jgi:hypothetical protein